MLTVQKPRQVGHVRRYVRVRGQGVDGERRCPGRQIRVDRPAAIRPHRIAQEPQRFLSHSVFEPAGRGETHGDKAGQRHRFQITAAIRLHPLEHAQAGGDRRATHETRERETRSRCE